VVEVHKGVYGPQTQAHFLAGHEFAGALQQHSEDAERLILEAQAAAMFAQFTDAHVDLEVGKADH
jgi:hypothetical protein